MYNTLKRIDADSSRIINMINSNADMFDILDTIFSNPYKIYNYNPVLRYITHPTMDSKYPYDYVVNVKYDDDSNITNVEHVIEIPVAGYDRDTIGIKTKGNLLLAKIGTDNVINDTEESSNANKTESTHIVNRGIKRGYTELGWTIRGLKSEYIVSSYSDGMLLIKVNIPVAVQKQQSDGWETINICGDKSDFAVKGEILNEENK